jgi:hypothetical protein
MYVKYGQTGDCIDDTEKAEKAVVKKRRVESMEDPIELSAHLDHFVQVTGPGWIGKTLTQLPTQVFTLVNLQKNYRIKKFDWNGR